MVNAEQYAKLREPFPPEAIGKKPVITCRACSQNKEQKHCDKHQRRDCNVCGKYMTTSHTHLDFVGHARVNDRLLEVDPGWDWSPFAIGPDGLPLLDRNGGLWIRLTVGDQTRLGYGHADGKTGGDAIKIALGDAIKNAAMRFGVALPLWYSDSAESAPRTVNDRPTGDYSSPVGGSPTSSDSSYGANRTPDTVEDAKGALTAKVRALDLPVDRVALAYVRLNDGEIAAETDPAKIRKFTHLLTSDTSGTLGETEPVARP